MNIELNGNVIIRHQAIPDCDKCDNAKKLLEEKGLVNYDDVENRVKEKREKLKTFSSLTNL